MFRVKVVRDSEEKMKCIGSLLKDGKKSLIFCDYIGYGKKIAERFGIPFVYSRTKNRLNTLREQ